MEMATSVLKPEVGHEIYATTDPHMMATFWDGGSFALCRLAIKIKKAFPNESLQGPLMTLIREAMAQADAECDHWEERCRVKDESAGSEGT